MPQTKAEKAAYNKQWNTDNAEKIKELRKQWDIDNRERKVEQSKQWKLKNPLIAKKSNIIGNWKRTGMIGDLSFIYDNDYLPATNCWVCNKIFKDTYDKCCDHDHSITDGDNWRQMLCRKCNNVDSWKNHSEWV